jgi:hypothetical protein
MPKTEVRNAIFEYLTPENSNIKYLGTVYPALPKVANESDLFNFVPPGTGVGALIYMFIESQEETRIALGGPHQGRKFRPYTLSLLCVLKSDLTTSAEGQVAFDEFIDSLTDYIQADRNAGNPNVIFQWAEGNERGGPDLRIDYPVPKTVNGGVMLFQAVARVTVCEVLNA